MMQLDVLLRHRLARTAAAAVCGVIALAGVAAAQPARDRADRISFGHLHVHAGNIPQHHAFWLEILGGSLGHVGKMDVSKIPDGLIEWISPTWGDTPPKGGTKGTTVDHVAFRVPDLRATLARAKAAGYPVVTSTELAWLPGAREADGIAVRTDKTSVAFVKGPDEFLVEFVEAKAQKEPVVMDHIHFAASQPAEMQTWYAKLTAAKAAARGGATESVIPGTHLTFTPTASPAKGTKGTVLDHIGFEVKDLPAMVEQLKGMGITIERFIQRKTDTGISIAYITDPWGTYIELTEGLDLVQ